MACHNAALFIDDTHVHVLFVQVSLFVHVVSLLTSCLAAGVTRQMLGRCGYDHDEHVEITEQLHQLAIGELEDDDWSD